MSKSLINVISGLIQEHASNEVKALEPDFCAVLGFNLSGQNKNKEDEVGNLFCVNNFKESVHFALVIAALSEMYFDILKRECKDVQEFAYKLKEFLTFIVGISGGEASVYITDKGNESIH